MNITQCYKVLDIPQNASSEEIRKAYVLLAKKTHPDITKEDNSEKFRQIVEAYETLSHYLAHKEHIFSEEELQDTSSTVSKETYPQSNTKPTQQNTSSPTKAKEDGIIVQPKKHVIPFQFLHKVLQKWIDDEQCVYLKEEMCLPNKTIRFTIRYGIASTKKIIEFTLPEDIQYGQTIRLKGAGKKIGSLTGDLYLQICKSEA